MERDFFNWRAFVTENDLALTISMGVEKAFLMDTAQNTVWMSKKTAALLSGDGAPLPPVITQDTFEQCLSGSSGITFRQEAQRLLSGKVERISCHVALRQGETFLSSMLHLFRGVRESELYGFLSVDYESKKEYDRNLENVIGQLRRAQLVNELTLEGSSDYIYQLDIVNNICTFSPKALEVLPLESPTFPDAMNRVLSFIVPEDRHIFLDSFVPFLTGQSDYHVAEYRVLTKQGTVMWISCHGKGTHDAEGHPLLIAGSLMDVTEQKKHEEEIRRMLYCDMLTGLKNQRSFDQEVGACLAQEGAQGSLLCINIRRFKVFNELFGREFGNRVLKEFAYMLQLYFSDALGIYRFNSDEFMVHLKETGRKEILKKMAPFRTALKKTREIEEHTFYINTQVAVVIYPEHGNTAEELVKNANQCLYRMNLEEKEEVSFFAGEMSNALSWQFLLENELRKDIESGFRHFRVVYQPIVELGPDGDRWIGAEALLRYGNPMFESLDQMELIRTLEYSGLIQSVGRWVVAQAAHECSRWNRGGNRAIVHVNIAAQQLADARLVNHIRDCCAAEGLPTDRLIVELTETSLVDNFEMATAFCEALMKMGMGVALDDFGTGYSSFNYLRHLPLNEIKVDREYTRQLPENRYNQLIVSFLYQLTEALGLRLCVEGVETEDELKLLKEMGVSLIQGFYFERPLEADVMRAEILEHGKKQQ